MHYSFKEGQISTSYALQELSSPILEMSRKLQLSILACNVRVSVHFWFRITESFRLKETSKISPVFDQSPPCQLNTARTTTSSHFSNTCRDSDPTTSLHSFFQQPFLWINYSWWPIWTSPSSAWGHVPHPIIHCLGEEANPQLAKPPMSGTCREWKGHPWASSSPT